MSRHYLRKISFVDFSFDHIFSAMMKRRASSRSAEASAAKKAKLAEDTRLSGTGQWQSVGKETKGICPLLYRKDTASKASAAIAAFDIDWTIIATKSGKQFPTGPSDWKFLHSGVPEKLRDLHKAGTRVVFFTNQGGIEKGRTTPKDFQKKVDAIINDVGIPVEVFVSTGESHYRKPSPRMWEYMEECSNEGITVDKKLSIYVGDAAGRKKGWKKDVKKDFACSDRMFAANVDVPFSTPEEFFLGENRAAFTWGVSEPSEILGMTAEVPTIEFPKDGAELVLLVGLPASGKSTFAQEHFVPRDYVHVNRDTLGTQEKCEKVAREALAQGKSVVVDNTNPSAAVRSEYIRMAQSAKVRARCFYLDTARDVARHLNYFRQNTSNGSVRRIPDVAYNMYKSKFEMPSADEGFTSVTTVPFAPRFSSAHQKKLFSLWT